MKKKPKPKIILVRHGQTSWNVDKRLQGQKDIPLGNHGRLQAQHLANYLRAQSFEQAFSSSLDRAKETAQIALSHRPLKLEIIPNLQEKNHGHWEGLLDREIQQRYPNDYELWKTNPLASHQPNGETLTQFQSRIISTWENLIHHQIDPSSKTVLVITHKFVIQIILCHISNLNLSHFWEFEQSNNCAINIIEYHDGIPHLIVHNLNIWESALTTV